jgi:hypothetical protein
VDVAAPPAVVYRWLCQLKVAPYSYDWIDNAGRPSPRTLTPGAERLAIGQRLIVAEIVEFEPDRQITAVSLPSAAALFGHFSMTYQVSPAAPGTRLICCLDVSAAGPAARLRRRPPRRRRPGDDAQTAPDPEIPGRIDNRAPVAVALKPLARRRAL